MGDTAEEGKRETQKATRRTRWEEVPAAGTAAAGAAAAARGGAAGAAAASPPQIAGTATASPAAAGGVVGLPGAAASPAAGVAAIMKSGSEGLAALKFNLQAAASAAREALEKAKKAALMQRALQEQLREARQQQQQRRADGGEGGAGGGGAAAATAAAAGAAGAGAAGGAAGGAAAAATGAAVGPAAAAAGRGLTLRTLLARGGDAGASSSLLLLGPAAAAAQLASASGSSAQEQQRLAVTTAAVAAAAAAAQQQQQQQDPQLQLLQLLRQQQQQYPLSAAAAAAGLGAGGGLAGAAAAAAAAAANKRGEQQAAAGTASATMQERPRPLRFDRFGREIDEEGRVVPLTLVPHSSLKINQRTNSAVTNKLEGPAVKRGGAAGAAAAEPEDITQATWYDPTIRTRTAYAKRKRKALQFVEPGTYMRQEEQMHAYQRLLLKQQRREQQRQQREAAAATRKGEEARRLEGEASKAGGKRIAAGGAAGASVLAAWRPAAAAGAAARPEEAWAEKQVCEQQGDEADGDEEEESDEEAVLVPEFALKAWAGPVPAVEPWDVLFLNCHPTNSGKVAQPKFEGDSLVEHPVPLKPATDSSGSVIINMYLTVEERKKLRRRKRQEKEREKQDKIRMGLMPPPPPKVKLTNLMRVLGDQAVADPSKVEREVKQQMAKRLEDHEQRNAARKLPEEARRKKQINKWKVKPGSREVHMLVFAIDVPVSRRNIYKMDTNAQQLHLSGVAAVLPPPLRSVVVVEGSVRSVKRFKALMLRRMKWTEAEGRPANEEDDEEPGSEGENAAMEGNSSCRLVWQGTARTNSFAGWSVQRAADTAEGRKIFKSSHLEHCWDTAQKYRDVRADYA